jgi:hypothetical protein
MNNTIPCVYVATMKTCTFGDRCKNVHYAVQLTNCKYCSGCSDVVVEGNIYKNKNRGRVCLFKHEKESHVNYIKRTNLSVEQPPIKKRKIDRGNMKESPKPSSVEVLMKVEDKLGQLEISRRVPADSKPSVPFSASFEDFPVLEVFVKKRTSPSQSFKKLDETETDLWSREATPRVDEDRPLVARSDTPSTEIPIENIETIVESVHNVTVVEPIPREEPVVEVPKVEESKVINKKDKKKEYKKRKWLETKLVEDAKIAEEKRVAEEKAEKKRQKRAAKKLRQTEVMDQPEVSPEVPVVKETTIEELKKAFKQHMLKERINELKKARTSKA